MKKILKFLAAIIALASCSQEGDGSRALFKRIDKEHHKIDFINRITESDSLNILTLEYIYNGGGVGIADFNGDGLSDIFFTGNMVANKLYLNKGGLKFKDVSVEAGIGAEEKWKSAVAVADVNGDGLPDVYVCATIKPDSALRQNMLFINQGVNGNGVPTFVDEAKAYNVGFAGHSSGAAFLDFDNDNDLDLYVMTNTIMQEIPTTYRPKINDGTFNADVLFRNNGNGTFSNISTEAGINHEGYGLGLAIADINQDGWTDIYVSNDYISNDLLYVNNADGTFTNRIDDVIKHQSQFSMGNDVADFNNDGHPDIVTLDMLPEGNLRRKTVITGSTYSSYINNAKYGYSPQYVRNMLQINNGDGTFSEIGQLAGIHQTEWSWSPLFLDVDNDGFRDLIVTNGFPRDITDKDFSNFYTETRTIASVKYQIDSIPVVKIPNYIFRNNGDLTFTDMTNKWGMNDASFSNGAAFADLDNDGDLDYVINNINAEVFLYENTLYQRSEEQQDNRFLRIKLHGAGNNTGGLGAKITLHYDRGRMQYHDHSVYRGYISSVEDIVHFGLDTVTQVDTVIVVWPDARINLLTNIKSDKVIDVFHRDSSPVEMTHKPASKPELLMNATVKSGVAYLHRELDRIDFNVQRTIPRKFSQSGPAIAVADVNGDGLEDFYVGGASTYNGALFFQRDDGSFFKKEFSKPGSGIGEDAGALFFDADNDGDNDLYVVSGTYEYPLDTPTHGDHLYLNDGRGNFRLDVNALPPDASSGSCVRAADVDADGDLDLFVGGNVVPAKYPFPAESLMLINDNGRFTNKTAEIIPELQFAGIINDAIWTDFNNDNQIDLVVAGELMPIQFYQNDGGQLKMLRETGLEPFLGWWNSLAAADFDSDGDIDFVAGNYGLNNYYKVSSDKPLRVYAKDFDGNNSIDPLITCYLRAEDGTMKEFPVHFWDELNSQSPKFRKKFKYYKQYGQAPINLVLTQEELEGAMVLETNYTATSFIRNLGNGRFEIDALPVNTQFAPINGLATADVNNDGAIDVLMIGNNYGNEIFTGRQDAFVGGVLLNDGNGKLSHLAVTESGFRVDGDGKALARLTTLLGDIFIASQNQDSLKVFSLTDAKNQMIFRPGKSDVWAELSFDNGKKQKVEFYFGSGYLSQSTRTLTIHPSVTAIKVYDAEGNSRDLDLSALAAR